MEKRFILFMVLSVAIMVAYVTLQATFAPKPPDLPVAENQDPAKQLEEEKARELDPTAKPDKEPGVKPEDEPKTETKPGETTPSDAKLETMAEPQKWATLGSVDPASPFRMLVTINSRGAALERIELASPKYRDLEDFTGYFGHLALTDERGGKGCRVNVVGAGTPAAQAKEVSDPTLVGIQVGDIIDGFGGQPVGDQESLTAFTKNTRAGQTIELNVTRGELKLTFPIATIRRPLEVVRPEFEVLPPGEPAEQHPLSCLLTIVNGRPVAVPKKEQTEAIYDPLRKANWKISTITTGKQPVIECSYKLTAAEAKDLGLSAPVEVIKRYSVAEITNPEDQDNAYAMAYHVDCELELRNLGTEPQEVSWQLDGPNGLPFEGWWYSNKISPGWGAAGARDLVWRRHESTRSFRSCPSIYTYAAKNPTKPAESMLGTDDSTQLDYVGVDGQYFSAVLIPSVDEDAERSSFRKAVTKPVYGIENIKKVDYKRTNVSFQVTSVPHALAVDGSFKQSMRLFAGPKVPALMAKYDLDDVIEYGWFRMVSIPLSSLLHFLKHYVVFNYALAIIALTVIVRGCMYPFSRQAAKNAQIMQEISPEIKKIAEKYKNDLQKRSDAQSELFKKYNYHPLSGCLPMFLQLPIFLGLYRSLAVDIELRQAALIPGIEWCSNLAGPDMLFFWKPYLPEFLAGEAAGWLGPYFNLLPLISVALLQVHQRLFTPPATDEQTKMTQDMMKYTTLFMGVLFFKVPAGLCIYFITSSLWSVCERVFLPKVKTPVPGEPVPEKTSFFAKKPSSNGEEKAKPTKKQRKR